jgi:hypothetical protein
LEDQPIAFGGLSGPHDLDAADLAERDPVLDYGAMAGQANFMTTGRPGISKFERVELRLDPHGNCSGQKCSPARAGGTSAWYPFCSGG